VYNIQKVQKDTQNFLQSVRSKVQQSVDYEIDRTKENYEKAYFNYKWGKTPEAYDKAIKALNEYNRYREITEELRLLEQVEDRVNASINNYKRSLNAYEKRNRAPEPRKPRQPFGGGKSKPMIGKTYTDTVALEKALVNFGYKIEGFSSTEFTAYDPNDPEKLWYIEFSDKEGYEHLPSSERPVTITSFKSEDELYPENYSQEADWDEREANFELDKSDTRSLQNYANRFDYDIDEVISSVKRNYVEGGMSIEEAVEEVKELMASGEDLF